MTVDVSVVLPAYNAADHLEQAVTRLLRQRNVSFEIVIVDDGSTDDTYAIASRLADGSGVPSLTLPLPGAPVAVTPAITAVRAEENEGVAAARERATRLAQGDYVWFVDSDDDWPDDALHTLLTAARASDADVVVAGARYVQSGKSDRAVGDAALSGSFDGRRAFELFLTGRISGHLWNKLFRRELALSIQFWRIQVHSDQAMVAQLLAGASRVTAVPTVVYRYVLRSGSIIRSGRKRSESLLAVGAVVETAARRFGSGVRGSAEYAYYQHRFIVASALKDATSGAYPAAEERTLFAAARAQIGVRGLVAVARRRDIRRLALLVAALLGRRPYRLLAARARS